MGQRTRAGVSADNPTPTKDVTLIISGVNPGIPEGRIAYIVYSAVKHLCKDVQPEGEEKGAANAESVPQGAFDRFRE